MVDHQSFDAIPSYFVARVNSVSPPLYALFEQRGQVLPLQNWMYVNVLIPVAPGYTFGSSIMFNLAKSTYKAHTRKPADQVIRDCAFETEGIEIEIRGGPCRGAQLISFFRRENEILPEVPNNALGTFRINREYAPRRFSDPILPMWEEPVPVAAPVAAPVGAPVAQEERALPVAAPVQYPVVVIPPPRNHFAADPMPAPRHRPRVPSVDSEDSTASGVSVHSAASTGLPAHVKTILIEAAIAKGESCPISMNPITKENAAVTSCGHVFDRDSIAQWLASSDRNGCAVCRERCVV